ncbi:hypothetical protein FB45DRAFT_915444 [Roridomyces roridus]|uniref:LYC1 C-terminal domain-containing protein n=1 Tax=Roridomyces roridus TaxID=1738132 RepID=A0AAD7BTE9_9AGAR|nr:hypothetical protein FB45DRAFT_915444 [Roridomyces roridus]
MTIDLASLSLFPATTAQITESRRRTHTQWGKGLTLDEHFAREVCQDELEVSSNGRFTVWVLAPRDDPETLHFKCSCETFLRTGIVKERDSDASRTVPCYGIASVFTPPQNRGQGFAKHMMRLLHWVLADPSLLPSSEFPAAWGAPPPPVPGARNGYFSALWSDVGHFYNACGPFSGTSPEGWVVKSTRTTVWEVDSITQTPESTVEWTWLDDSGVSELWQHDASILRSAMSTSDSLSCTFLPDNGVAAYQHKRLDSFINRLETPPQTWGVSAANRAAYATWIIDPRPPAPRTLIVTRLYAEPQIFAELLGRIVDLARKYDVKHIEIWNMPAELEAFSTGAKTFDREEHLPALKWYGKESEEAVSWKFNERFCWC